MRRALAPFSKLESSNHTQSSADFITNTSGFSFRYTQIDHIGDSFELALISGSPTPVVFMRAEGGLLDLN
jgi:hypothetical protein